MVNCWAELKAASFDAVAFPDGFRFGTAIAQWQVEGDLDVKVTITDGVVTDAWTEAAMFRGFEIILRGKDPQAGLIMTPRICGICGGGCSGC